MRAGWLAGGLAGGRNKLILDLKKKEVFYYNPMAEAEAREIDSIRLAGSVEFAVCHFKGRFTEMERITNEDLAAMRLSVATQLLSFKHFLIDTCPKCGFAVDEAEQKCGTWGRDFHFKPYCVEDDLVILKRGEKFSCMLCRSGFWDLHRIKQVDEDVVITKNVAEEIFHVTRAAPSSDLVGYHKPKDTDGEFLAACEPYLSSLRQVRSLQDQQLVKMLSKDKQEHV
ncbi:hypothetical protein DPMN_109105 [Dreissena polymorpha]|uniref:Uncharacterized protein n=1 Tax=Dreissena polymorpha TaxID=45954 RepID=A0A9D4KA58_DREPO|nr:hypothetical protein DPMN_109105 [Dreissena polymorpha]